MSAETKKIITPDDLGEGIEWNPVTKKYESKLLFLTTEGTADLNINGMQLLFRALKNSNRVMCVTGIKIGGQWYGDAPDSAEFINPFTNETGSGL